MKRLFLASVVLAGLSLPTLAMVQRHSSHTEFSQWAAKKTAGSGRGPWYLARSKALSTGLSNAYFRSLGLPSLIGAC